MTHLTLYFLESITDFINFERLCSDLLYREGYENIEPLGGYKDGGEDAKTKMYSDVSQKAIFQYSLRRDWGKKMLEDLKKVKDEKYDIFIFVTNRKVTGKKKRDIGIKIKDAYNVNIEIYDIEWLRMLFDTPKNLDLKNRYMSKELLDVGPTQETYSKIKNHFENMYYFHINPLKVQPIGSLADSINIFLNATSIGIITEIITMRKEGIFNKIFDIELRNLIKKIFDFYKVLQVLCDRFDNDIFCYVSDNIMKTGNCYIRYHRLITEYTIRFFANNTKDDMRRIIARYAISNESVHEQVAESYYNELKSDNHLKKGLRLINQTKKDIEDNVKKLLRAIEKQDIGC